MKLATRFHTDPATGWSFASTDAAGLRDAIAMERDTRTAALAAVTDLGVRWAFTWRPFCAYGRWHWLFYREHVFSSKEG